MTSLQQLKISNKLSAETAPIVAHTENSVEREVFSNSQSTYTTPNSLTARDIIESNNAMFSALTEVLQTTMDTPNVK